MKHAMTFDRLETVTVSTIVGGFVLVIIGGVFLPRHFQQIFAVWKYLAVFLVGVNLGAALFSHL